MLAPSVSEADRAFARRETQLRTWMMRGLDGDGQAHVALLRAIRPLLIAFFGRRTGADSAEDLVQEVLIVVHERRTSYDPGRPFLPWLFSIARHKLVDHFRRSRRYEPVAFEDDMLCDEAFGARCDARMDVARLLAMLPEKQAGAIRDTRLRGLSVADAARRAGIGESDVKVSAHRGILALRARVSGGAP